MKLDKNKLFTLFILLLFSSNISAEIISTKMSFTKAELSWVNYLQKNGNAHTVQLSWIPKFIRIVDDIDISTRLGVTYMPVVKGGGEDIWIGNTDLIAAYTFSNYFSTELILGVDIWEGVSSFFELGAAISIETKTFRMLQSFESLFDQMILSASYIFNHDERTYNISYSIRRTF